MTFEEWWGSIGMKESNIITKVLLLAIKELAEKAWYASRNCPECGRDLKLTYCPDCK